MHRAAPKRLPKSTKKMQLHRFAILPRVNEDLYARPSNLWSIRRAPPSSAWMPNLNTREEESG
jgi:hypothetical protein